MLDLSAPSTDAVRPLAPPAAPPLRGATGWGLVAILYAVAYEVARRMPVGNVAARAISNAALFPLPMLIAVLSATVARGFPRGNRARRAWGLVAAAFACEVLGNAIWCVQEDLLGLAPARSPWAYVAHLLYYPLILAGLWSFGKPFHLRAERYRLLLDLVTVGTSAAVIVLHYVWAPGHVAADGTLLPLAYPVGDLTTFIGLSSIVIRRPAGIHPAALRALRAGVCGQFLGNAVWAVLEVRGAYATGGLANTFWAVGYAALAVAVDAQRRAGGAVRETRDDGAEAVPLHPLPFAAAAFACAVLILECALGHPDAPTDLAVGVTVIAATIAVRQVLTLRQNARLLKDRARLLGEARLSALVRHAADAVWVLDETGHVRWTSTAQTQDGRAPLFARPFAEAVGAPGAAWIRDLLDRSVAHPHEPQRGEGVAAAAGGRSVRLEVTLTNLLDESPVHGLVANVRDVTERAALEDQLTHQAFHDPLTGLANRVLLADRVQHALARCVRTGASVAVCVLDLDDFKTVNDGLGHGAGDNLLVQVAQRIRRQIRDSDTAARLGGDEFAVLTEDLGANGGPSWIGERLTAAFREPFEIEGHEVFVTASVGLSVAAIGDTGETLLRNADTAMYVAKGRARGLYEIYEPSMHAAARENLELHNLLRNAIEHDDIYLEYQPVHRLSTGAIVGVEALARWAPRGREPVPPSRFIPLAESTGLIVPLGLAVLRRAIGEASRVLASWPRGRPPILAVNVSPRQLQDADFARAFRQILDESGYDPRLLCVELTESVFVQRAESVRTSLDGLRALGVKIGIDDFGTGYSSLSSLHRFPLDVLKIPREFVERLGHGDNGAMLAQSIIALGAALGLRAIAEGVETAEQVAALRSLGCDLGQGYHFGRPTTLDEVIVRARALRDGWLVPGQTPGAATRGA
jgi:diguanylate cyclase (GGDEF)-like protein